MAPDEEMQLNFTVLFVVNKNRIKSNSGDK